jgi:hypothetical protein
VSALALRITEAEEAHADAALLALSKLRDQLVRRNANFEACRVDEAIEALTKACRK